MEPVHGFEGIQVYQTVVLVVKSSTNNQGRLQGFFPYSIWSSTSYPLILMRDHQHCRCSIDDETLSSLFFLLKRKSKQTERMNSDSLENQHHGIRSWKEKSPWISNSINKGMNARELNTLVLWFDVHPHY